MNRSLLIKAAQSGALMAFSFGLLLFCLGNVITFVPGAEVGWFIFAGLSMLGGFFVPRWFYKIGALVGVALCVSAAIQGHHNGNAYRQHLPERGLPKPR